MPDGDGHQVKGELDGGCLTLVCTRVRCVPNELYVDSLTGAAQRVIVFDDLAAIIMLAIILHACVRLRTVNNKCHMH